MNFDHNYVKTRAKQLKTSSKEGNVLYWMTREQRLDMNFTLYNAIYSAHSNTSDLIIVFNLLDDFLDSADRNFKFMLEGLSELENQTNNLELSFKLLIGKPKRNIKKVINELSISEVYIDFSPLRIAKEWRDFLKEMDINLYVVDSHNVIPCWITSDKKEFAAHTIRKKVHAKFKDYYKEEIGISEWLERYPISSAHYDIKHDFNKILENFNSIQNSIEWCNSGEKSAIIQLEKFMQNFENYHEERNDPNAGALSNMSPYLHFGQISSMEIINHLKAQGYDKKYIKEYEVFFEELIVRKELADNFCFYEKDYDNFNGFHVWAKKTHNEHRSDKREYVYEIHDFENANTHDNLWNAAQTEMVVTGKMHGYLRMYWAKKILEWTDSPEQAMKFAIYLNDKYSLDGRDPNGYTGIAWSIGGIHDRAWTERQIFGKIRYMNYNGCKRKFDVDQYIERNLHKQVNFNDR